MLNRRTMIALVVMTACSLAGVGYAQPATPTITLDANANGGTTTVALGTIFAISLPENPTTGYTWKLQPLATPVVGIIGDRYVPETGEPRSGAGGNRTMTFAALAAGTETIVLTRQRAWEETAPPAETFTVTITVSPEAKLDGDSCKAC